MSTTTRTTELEAINTMLSCIEESPINSLAVSGLQDVDIAKSVLNEVSRAVQLESWTFNSETEYQLLRDINGKISVPVNALKVDPTKDYADYDAIQRGGYLYSRKNKSFVFDKDLKVDITFLLPWDDLPEAARQYIMIRAARVFQVRRLGSDTQHKFSEAEEFTARSNMSAAEGDSGDYNMLSGSWSVASILDR